MSSLSVVRQFIDARLKEVNPRFKAHNDAFNSDNIGELNLDYAYHVFYADMSNVSVDQSTSTNEVSVSVYLFTKTNNYAQEKLDNAFDEAIKFQMYCINPIKLNNGFIKKVRFQSMRAEPLVTNDNAIVIKVNLKFTLIYGLNVDLTCDC